jgi:Domain of unknown function (DUF3291)
VTSHQLAQLNVARLRAPLEHSDLQPFVNWLPVVNGDAEAATGFVWRLMDDDGVGATGIRPAWAHSDDLIVNLTVWESLETLRAFYLSGRHLEIMRRRREFFRPHDGPYVVLWWVEAGHIPDLDEAKLRLDHLAAQGPSSSAFTLREPFAAPAAATA